MFRLRSMLMIARMPELPSFSRGAKEKVERNVLVCGTNKKNYFHVKKMKRATYTEWRKYKTDTRSVLAQELLF